MSVRFASRFGALLLLLWLARPLSARADIPVFIGFMDEEVKTVLKTLVETLPGRAILVIEREDYKDLVAGKRRVVGSNGRLFQTPLAYHTKAPAGRIKVSTQADSSGNKELAHRLAAAIRSTSQMSSSAPRRGDARPSRSRTPISSGTIAIRRTSSGSTSI